MFQESDFEAADIILQKRFNAENVNLLANSDSLADVPNLELTQRGPENPPNNLELEQLSCSYVSSLNLSSIPKPFQKEKKTSKQNLGLQKGLK